MNLDFNIARMGLEDCEEVDDDNEGQVQLDPSVWAHPIKSHENHGMPGPFSSIPKADAYIRQHFPNPFQQHIGNQQIHSNNQEQSHVHHQQQQQHQLKPVSMQMVNVMQMPYSHRNIFLTCNLFPLKNCSQTCHRKSYR